MPPSRRNDLIDAAMRVFYRDGFNGTSIDRVLEEGSISRMTLYNHFKSKDELIIAALRRRDEIFRNDMMKFVEKQATDPVERILAIFDFHAKFASGRDFCGCMFINASAEFSDPECAVRQLAASHKAAILRYVRDLTVAANLNEPDVLAEQLCILIEGTIVTAQVVGLARNDGASPTDAADHARAAAQQLINAATLTGTRSS